MLPPPNPQSKSPMTKRPMTKQSAGAIRTCRRARIPAERVENAVQTMLTFRSDCRTAKWKCEIPSWTAFVADIEAKTEVEIRAMVEEIVRSSLAFRQVQTEIREDATRPGRRVLLEWWSLNQPPLAQPSEAEYVAVVLNFSPYLEREAEAP